MDVSAELNNSNNKMAFGPRIVRSSDPDVYSNPDSARVRARQIGCIGIRRYNNRDGSVSWMPCTNESDYRRVSGFGISGRRFRRQQLEREVRQIMGGRSERKPMNKSANYTKPELRETIKKRIMAGSNGGKPGQWSARKAQMLAAAYKKAGGGYKGGKSKTQRSLSSWTRQKWRTSDGKPAIRGNVTRRYLPAKAWDNLTPAQRAATNRKKIIGSKKGRQFVSNTLAAQNARKRSVRGQKHIEFYEDLEFKAIGPRKPRAIRSARSTASFGRRARRIGGSLRDGLRQVPFDPNPKDADADNVAQEGTIHERPFISRTIDAIRQAGKRTVERVAKPFKKPINSEDRVFSRAESVSDGRFLARAPQSLVKPRVASRAQRPKKRKIKKSTRAAVAQDTQDNIELKPAPKKISAPRILPRADSDDVIDNLQNERKNIYKAFTVEGVSVAQLADQFDVVRDEIRDAILRHEKARNASLRGFRARNTKLFDAVKNFGNSKNVILEAIKERKVRDWDSMLVYAFKNPEIRKNNKHIDLQNDIFDAFKTGKNPDGTGNLVLGYLPSKKGPENPPIKAFGDQRKLSKDFRPLSQILRSPKTTGTISDVSERATRRYRTEYARAGAEKRSSIISGRMAASSMTPKEEREWKKKEWKRRLLQEYSLNPNIVTEYPTLAAEIGDKGYVRGIEHLEGLNDAAVEKLWNDTLAELLAANKQIPAYQVRNAPLSPNELATAATVKRPLVKVFLDAYKKTSPIGELAKLDSDKMNDGDIESFYNTFILPELVNNGAPTNQDIEQALIAPTASNRLDAAEQLLLTMPSNLKTLELRLKFAKYTLAQSGITSDDPDFEQKLQELMAAQIDQDANSFFKDIEAFLRGKTATKKIVINPKTGETFTPEELDQAILIAQQNVADITNTLPEEVQEQMMALQALQQVFTEILTLDEILKTAEKNQSDIPPINPLTNRPYKLRDWIELGRFGLAKRPNNPLTGKPYLDSELKEHLGRVGEKIEELNNQIGTAKLAELNQQNGFWQRLLDARAEIEPPADGDIVDDVSPGDGNVLVDPNEPEEEEKKSQEEIDAEIQEFLDKAAEFLQADTEYLTVNQEDIDRSKTLRKRLEIESGPPTNTLPTNPEWWAENAALVMNPATGQPWGPYTGDPEHPYNKIPIDFTDPTYKLPQSLYREFLDPNNPEVKEWLDINNSHTVGRYTAEIPELAAGVYQGNPDALDPERIDPRLNWNRMINFIERSTPSFFKRNKKGELVGDVSALTQPGNYGGASFSNAPFDPSVDASGYQYKAQLEELYEAKRRQQENDYLNPKSAAAKTERAKLWGLFETAGLTPSEIVFTEEILDPVLVDSALNLHMVDNNISSATYSTLMSIAQQGEQNRTKANNKKRLEREINGLRALANLSSPGSFASSSRDMERLIDAEILRIKIEQERVRADYDTTRRTYMFYFKQINNMLQGRPPLQVARFDKKGNKIQRGWDIKKQTKAEYFNSIEKWDEIYIDGFDGPDGERVLGQVTAFVNVLRAYQLQTGDSGSSSAFTAISRVADNKILNLQAFKNNIAQTQSAAQRAGISGFMRVNGGLTGLGQAEEITRQAAEKAAFGNFRFINPKLLRRYDIGNFDVTKSMVGNASGFNRQFKNEIKDATRNNNKNISARPGFNYLGSREKDLVRQMDNIINSRDVRKMRPTQNRITVGAKISRAQQSSKSTNTNNVFSVNPNPVFVKRGISGRMGTRQQRIDEFGIQDYKGSSGIYQVGIEKIGDGHYLVNRHGEIIDDRVFSSYDKAKSARLKINIDAQEKKRALESTANIARYDAATKFIRQSGYVSSDVDMQSIKDVSPLERNSEGKLKPNRYIIAADAKPKHRAGDIVVLRKNPETQKLELLLIERIFGPHRKDGESTMNLPGGFFREEDGDKDLFDTARREAFEETGLGLPENELLSMEQLGTIDAVDWDPRFAKGIEVGALMVEVPSTWEPKAGDDAAKAEFFSLEEVANGNIPLGFGHMAWLEEAFGGHEDEELAKLGGKFAILNILARQRQQRIIKAANIKRREFNETLLPDQPSLFDKEKPKLNLFPSELPDSTVGWTVTGPESTERHARRIENAQKKIRGNMALNIGTPLPNVSGRMASNLKELDVEGFAKLGKGRREQIIDDVYNMRRAGMDKRTIASQLAILYSIPRKKTNNSNMSGFAPTDELVFKIISDGKKLGKLKIDSKNKKQVLDKYSKRVLSDHKDVMNLANNGLTAKDISETLDMSESRVKTYLRSLGYSLNFSNNSENETIEVDKRIANAPIEKAIYVDSTYGRMSMANLTKKYKMDKSQIAESINSYRSLAESLEQDSHRLYRQALDAAEPSLLSADETDIVRMRLDGLNFDEIMLNKKLNPIDIRTLEQTALAKLRATNSNNFLELDDELAIQNIRKSSTFEYMTNLLTENPQTASGLKLFKKIKNKEFAARELRDYRNMAKDFYMMNQYMGVSVDELGKQYKTTAREIQELVDVYTEAVDKSDKFKNKALRRALSADINNSLLDADINFISMRNDGASINDISRYLQVKPTTLRARQIVLMNRLNQQQGISGKMQNVPNLEDRDLYSELGIPNNSSVQDVENAFQSIVESLFTSATKNNNDSWNNLKRASEAFSILGNPNYRDSYSDIYKENSETIRKMALELANNWPKSFYKEPMTEKMRPTWVRDAINGKPINSQNIFKMPHHLGSDEIIDDIDDGILGFPTNDSDKEFSISNTIYQEPIPGTPKAQYAFNTSKKKIENRKGDNFSYGKISGRMAGMFDGLSAKEKEDKIQKLIAGFAEGNDMLPNYRRGKRVPIPVFPENKLDTINIAEIRKLPKIERVKKMLDFVREELANDRPIYSHTSLGDVFSLPVAGVNAILPGEIPNYSTRKKEAWKKWKNALSAYVLDNKNKTLLDLADEIDSANNERLVDQAPELGLLRKEFFGPIKPFKKRKPKNIVRLRNGKEFTKKEYKILQRKLLKMWSEGFAPTDIDKKLDVPEKWAQYQIRDLAKQNKLPKLPSPELSIIQYAADGFTATDIISRFFRRENWSDWDTDRIMEFVKKDGRFPNFKRGFRKVEDELANNAFVQRPLQRFREKRKNMNSRAIAELNRIELDRAKKALERMKIEEPTRYQELQAKRRTVAKKRTPEQLAARRKYQNEWRERTGRTKKSNKTKPPKISGEMALPRKNWTGRDFYAELEADKNDNIKTLRKKYGLIAMRDHPDKSPGDKAAAERFRRAAEAWGVLSLPEERRVYDSDYYPRLPNRQTTDSNRFGFRRPAEPQQPQPQPQPSRPAPPPPPPPRPKLPPLNDSLGKQIGVDLPFTKTDLPYNFYEDSFAKYGRRFTPKSSTPIDDVSYVKIPSTFGPAVDVQEDRFWNVYYKIADAMSGKKIANATPRFVSVGGAPGSGKTSIRKLGIPSLSNVIKVNIPSIDEAVHVDADEIKPLIPEAKNAHANNLPDWASMVHEESRVIADMAIRMGVEKNRDIVYDSTGQFNRGFDTLEEARKKGYKIELHYMVTSLETTLSDRVKARTSTDPRTMPEHIIPATTARNRQIMHKLVQYADQFYLWDTEGSAPELLAYKEGWGKPLIINSPRAFLHGDFEATDGLAPDNLTAVNKIFDKPNFNLQIAPVSTQSRSGLIIADFKKTNSVSATASNLKAGPREVFNIVTRSFIDPSIKEPKTYPGGRGFPGGFGTNTRFNRPAPPILDDDDYLDSDLSYDFETDRAPYVDPLDWEGELGKAMVDELKQRNPLLSRAMFSYTPADVRILDYIAYTNRSKRNAEKNNKTNPQYENSLIDFLREEERQTVEGYEGTNVLKPMNFDMFWDELQREAELENDEGSYIIEMLLNSDDEEATKDFLEQFRDVVRDLLNVYPKGKSRPIKTIFDRKDSKSIYVDETTRAIKELIANDFPHDNYLGAVWAFSYGIGFDKFEEMYNNVKTTGNIFGDK